MERFIEKSIYMSRWLLAPVYLGLSLALLALGVKFFQEALHLLLHFWEMKEADMILISLSLIDIALVGGLIIMVMFSGYENFVSKIDLDEGQEKLGWLGKMDSGTLKNKVAASIVAISSIHLLKVFMKAETYETKYLMWYVLMHLTFVLSAFIMAYQDRLTRKA